MTERIVDLLLERRHTWHRTAINAPRDTPEKNEAIAVVHELDHILREATR